MRKKRKKLFCCRRARLTCSTVVIVTVHVEDLLPVDGKKPRHDASEGKRSEISAFEAAAKRNILKKKKCVKSARQRRSVSVLFQSSAEDYNVVLAIGQCRQAETGGRRERVESVVDKGV